MSCNGCRVLRKGCSENCMLRPCLQWLDTAEAQGHATVFVAKFFGRAGLMSFISAVPDNQRPALFQSLLYEAAGRTVNPVNGAVGLLSTGNWHVCQAAVETVLRGGVLRPIPEFVAGPPEMDEAAASSAVMFDRLRVQKRRRGSDNEPGKAGKGTAQLGELDLSLKPVLPSYLSISSMMSSAMKTASPEEKTRRLGSPSMNSEESGTTTCLEISGCGDQNRQMQGKEPKLLNLFN